MELVEDDCETLVELEAVWLVLWLVLDVDVDCEMEVDCVRLVLWLVLLVETDVEPVTLVLCVKLVL